MWVTRQHANLTKLWEKPLFILNTNLVKEVESLSVGSYANEAQIGGETEKVTESDVIIMNN